jgi:type IV pilus assembly protein PilE
MRRNQKGFTLMELMVVIVIVAILAAVAVPLYINYVRDARRTEARGAIGAIITAEQTYFQKTGAYTSLGPNLNVDLSDLAGKWTTTVTGAGNTFTATMTGVAGTDNAGLQVQVVYTRGNNPPDLWTEQ